MKIVFLTYLSAALRSVSAASLVATGLARIIHEDDVFEVVSMA